MRNKNNQKSKKTKYESQISDLPLFFNFLSDFVNFFLNGATRLAFPPFTADVVVMAKAMFTSPWTLSFLFGRRIQTTHMVLAVAVATT